MSVIRVQKNKNFTTMSNIHLRDKELSLKAKGLMSVMLSLPDNWNYSIKGLCAICKEKESAVKSTLDELRERRYVIVERIEPSKETGGRIQYEYFVYEQPQGDENQKVDVKEAYKAKQETEKQPVKKQGVENLGVEFLAVENQGDILNTNISNTEEENTKGLSTDKKEHTVSKDTGKVHTVVSERNRQHAQKPIDKYLALKDKETDMLKRVAMISLRNYDEETACEVFTTIRYFLMRYTQRTGKVHPILSNETLEHIVDTIANFGDWEYGHFENVIGEKGKFAEIVDEYFNTNFGEINGGETNYRLPHFVSDEILNRVAHRVVEY